MEKMSGHVLVTLNGVTMRSHEGASLEHLADGAARVECLLGDFGEDVLQAAKDYNGALLFVGEDKLFHTLNTLKLVAAPRMERGNVVLAWQAQECVCGTVASPSPMRRISALFDPAGPADFLTTKEEGAATWHK
jgi:hypothetical protein